jgi:hypothetical protein
MFAGFRVAQIISLSLILLASATLIQRHWGRQ